MKRTNQQTYGTSFHSQTITTTVNKLKQVMGEPYQEQNNGQDKTNFDFKAETEAGDIFTVYDWKYYRPINEDEAINFHIGAMNQQVGEQAKIELLSALSQL